ncbi:hypothetical protein DL767_000160 [Monosporascus sp. MG133]|nr:hypothetical protein DL767_000160 [Monosporascus sp. MG133]
MAKAPVPPLRKYERICALEDVENPENYEPGGFHPVNLFDVLEDRFQVIYKLGFGGIAMVWLCYEFKLKRWRAVKINAASHSAEDCAELKVLQIMRDKGVTADQLDTMHIVVPSETFWIDGPNGRHLCSVMPVLGPRVSWWRDEVGTEYDRVDRMSYQFTEGLSFLHRMGVAHGDFRPANILTRLDEHAFDEIDVDEMKHILDAPDMELVLTTKGEASPHAPECVVTPVRWTRLAHLIIDEIAIVDFGEAYKFDDPPSYLGIPRHYAAPEILFDGTPTAGSDIWSLAYTLIEFRLSMSFVMNTSSILWRMERFAGPLPSEYREVAVRMLEERGDSLQISSDDSTRITENLEKLNQMDKRRAEGTDFTDHLEITLGAKYLTKRFLPPGENADSDQSSSEEWVMEGLPKTEVILFADLLRRMFKYYPEERLSPSDALEHEWFNRKRVAEEPRKESRAWYSASILVLGCFILLLGLLWILYEICRSPKRSLIYREPPDGWVEVCRITTFDVSR